MSNISHCPHCGKKINERTALVITVDGKQYNAVLAGTSNPYADQWNLLDEDGKPFASHSLPKHIKDIGAGDKVALFTSGHSYRIVG